MPNLALIGKGGWVQESPKRKFDEILWYSGENMVKFEVFATQRQQHFQKATVFSKIKAKFGEICSLEFNVPFQHKYGYIRDENLADRGYTLMC